MKDNLEHWVKNGNLLPRCRAQRALYNVKNKDKRDRYNQTYYENNSDYILSSLRLASKEKKANITLKRRKLREINPLLRIKDSYSTAAKRAFAQNGFKKDTKSAALLGCSFEELKIHLQLQFSSEMLWTNYGTIWEIDHICPMHQARTYDEVVLLCHYFNLRPLLVTLNRRKHKRKTQEAEIMCKSLLKRDWK